MSKVITAEYLAANNMLQLDEPLDGVRDHQTVRVEVTAVPDNVADPERPWLALSGTLSKEAGEELSAALDELFPPWND